MQPTPFFEDGIAKDVVITERIKKESAAGRPYYQFKMETPDSSEKYTLTDFGFLDKVSELSEQINLNTTIIEVLPVKVGERAYNGKTYDTFDFRLDIKGEREAPVASPTEEEIKTEEVKF